MVRPLLFVAMMIAIVALPLIAYHVGVALGAIPRRSLTWLPASDRGSVYGWEEREQALAISSGNFADLGAVFGPGVDVNLGADPRSAGATSPFAAAQGAYMAVLPPEGSAIVARFATAQAAEAAAREYAAQALGQWPPTGKDGLRTARRPGGDQVKIAQVGRTLAIVSGTSERELTQRLLALGAIAPAQPPSDPGSERYWLYRPGVLPAISVALVLLYIVAFFRGAAWAGTIQPVPGVELATEPELREQLLRIDSTDIPLKLAREEGGQRLVATWRFANARWLDLARARKMQYTHRLLLDFDAASHVVRMTEQMTRFDAAAGISGGEVEWRTARGITFFQVEQGRVFGLQFDAGGKPMPRLDYTWRFDAQEMKAPLIDAVTRAGWQWRPVPWSGPQGLRWLTD